MLNGTPYHGFVPSTDSFASRQALVGLGDKETVIVPLPVPLVGEIAVTQSTLSGLLIDHRSPAEALMVSVCVPPLAGRKYSAKAVRSVRLVQSDWFCVAVAMGAVKKTQRQ